MLQLRCKDTELKDAVSMLWPRTSLMFVAGLQQMELSSGGDWQEVHPAEA